MNANMRFLPVLVAALTSLNLASPIEAADKEGQWLRVSHQWLLHRFVRPSTAPARTYRVAVVVPPGSKNAKPAQSSGSSDVDKIAGDYAMDMIRNTSTLRDLAKSKELYFQFVVSPPALDIKMRSKAGKLPPPPGKELYTPISDTFFHAPNQNETTSRMGEMTVIFPPSGGYASEAIVTTSTGNAAVDRYFLHISALNWQTTSTSSREQVYRRPFGAAAPQRWQSILDR
ncbi:MAG TPA: hypothetical protein VNP98_06465 [Chthoniobacterales bacterium]|nr:hypothetical protein [Chthoniobacterales bacterium]